MNLTNEKKVKSWQIGTSKKKLRFCSNLFRTINGKRVVQFNLFIKVLGFDLVGIDSLDEIHRNKYFYNNKQK